MIRKREEYKYEEVELPRDLWVRIYESVLLLRWIDKWKKAEIVYIDILACGLVKHSWKCFDKLARDQAIAEFIEKHKKRYPMKLEVRITPIPYNAKGERWELLETTNGASYFREFVI